MQSAAAVSKDAPETPKSSFFSALRKTVGDMATKGVTGAEVAVTPQHEDHREPEFSHEAFIQQVI